MANTSAGALETEMSALGMRNSYNDDDMGICAQDCQSCGVIRILNDVEKEERV